MEAHGARDDRREGKVARGWRLTQVAWTLVRGDRAMLSLALLGIGGVTVASLTLCYLGGYLFNDGGRAHHPLIPLLALYPLIFGSTFLNVALACAANAALDDEQLTAREALHLAYVRRGRIAVWSLISMIVGMVISNIANRLPGGARLIGWLAGVAWGLGTLFVVPIIATEGAGPLDSAKRSVGLVRRRWGEGLSGGLAIGAWTVLVALPAGIAIGIGVALHRTSPGAGAALVAAGAGALLAVSVVAAATRQVFAVALYRYAIDAPTGAFSNADLEYPFAPRKEQRKSWILRIGGTFLALFAVLVVIAAIFGHHRHTAAEGYFHVDYASEEAPPLRPGAAVTYQQQRIGEVTAVSLENGILSIEFHVVPAAREIVESNQAFPVGPETNLSLCLGTPAECHGAPLTGHTSRS